MAVLVRRNVKSASNFKRVVRTRCGFQNRPVKAMGSYDQYTVTRATGKPLDHYVEKVISFGV